MPISILHIFPPHHFFSLAEENPTPTPVRPGGYQHSPARIIGQLLIDNSIGLDGEEVPISGASKTSWYVFDNREPDKPDLIIKVSDTQGRDSGYCQDGQRQEHPGIQVQVRSVSYRQGYYKANQIAQFLDSINKNLVTILDETDVGTSDEDTTYIVNSVERVSNVIPLGSDTPQGKRQLFVINAICYLRVCC